MSDNGVMFLGFLVLCVVMPFYAYGMVRLMRWLDRKFPEGR